MLQSDGTAECHLSLAKSCVYRGFTLGEASVRLDPPRSMHPDYLLKIVIIDKSLSKLFKIGIPYSVTGGLSILASHW